MNAISRDLYPFDGRFVEVGGLRLHCLDEGRGHPVVMVHGNPTWSFYYRELVKALRGDHRCIVPDHIGCGLSDKPASVAYPYTLERRVEDLLAVLAQLVPTGPFTLVVHDWGGMIGLAAASRFPERVARLVVLNTAAFGLPETKRFPARLGLIRNSGLGAFLVLRLNAFARGATFMATARGLPPAVKAAYTAPYDTPEHRIATLRFVQDIPLAPGEPGYDLVKDVGDQLGARFARTPTLICWGAQDWVFDDHFLRVWREKLPHAEVHRWEDAGHYVLEDRRDDVIARVQDFFRRYPVES